MPLLTLGSVKLVGLLSQFSSMPWPRDHSEQSFCKLSAILHGWRSASFLLLICLLREFHDKYQSSRPQQDSLGTTVWKYPLPTGSNFPWVPAQTVRALLFVFPGTLHRQVGIEPALWMPLLQSDLSLLRPPLPPRLADPGPYFPNLFDPRVCCLSLGLHVRPTLRNTFWNLIGVPSRISLSENLERNPGSPVICSHWFYLYRCQK